METHNLNEFADGTKNAAIFETTSPFDNEEQGNYPRWLFVCSAGLLRSPTGAAVAIKHGINARSAGSATHYALIPVSANLIEWAHKIIFVNDQNYRQTLHIFEKDPILQKQIRSKSIVLDIPDVYNYNEDALVAEFEQQLFNK